MKHLKEYEKIEIEPSEELVDFDPRNDNYDSIKRKVNQFFDTEEEFLEWCMEQNNSDDPDNIDFDNIIAYDIPVLLLGLNPYNEDLSDILVDVVSNLNFDEFSQERDVDEETWDAKKDAKKYNL
jgi:hypothetical protein